MSNIKETKPQASLAEGAKSLKTKEEGGGMVEYVLLVSLIAIACIFALRAFSGSVSRKFSSIGSQL